MEETLGEFLVRFIDLGTCLIARKTLRDPNEGLLKKDVFIIFKKKMNFITVNNSR